MKPRCRVCTDCFYTDMGERGGEGGGGWLVTEKVERAGGETTQPDTVCTSCVTAKAVDCHSYGYNNCFSVQTVTWESLIVYSLDTHLLWGNTPRDNE